MEWKTKEMESRVQTLEEQNRMLRERLEQLEKKTDKR
jgi:chaperonin cofactor prefoldin